jgi:branched-chain amino acid aminotransferase
LCKKNGISVLETHISPNDIYSFEAAFLAGTMIEIMPISRIESIDYDTLNNIIFKSISRYLKNYVYEMES